MGGSGQRQAWQLARAGAAAGLCVALANCASSGKYAGRIDPRYGVSASERVVAYGEPVPKGGGVYRVGKPYVVGGRVYVPEDDEHYVAEGLASWYGDDFHGRRTANGEVFDMDSLSAAHPTLPMPCYVRVTNLRNRKSIILRVNDRGPYHSNRLIDVSGRAAALLGFRSTGVARVRVEYVGRASLDGSDDTLLAATLREGEPAPAPSAVRLASARPFLPRGGATPAVLRDVPLPQDRPYTLGQDGSQDDSMAPPPAARQAVARASEPELSQAAALAPRSLDEQARALGGSALPPAASAYAPSGQPILATARGLY